MSVCFEALRTADVEDVRRQLDVMGLQARGEARPRTDRLQFAITLPLMSSRNILWSTTTSPSIP
jgi:hypothetical protein